MEKVEGLYTMFSDELRKPTLSSTRASLIVITCCFFGPIVLMFIIWRSMYVCSPDPIMWGSISDALPDYVTCHKFYSYIAIGIFFAFFGIAIAAAVTGHTPEEKAQYLAECELYNDAIRKREWRKEIMRARANKEEAAIQAQVEKRLAAEKAKKQNGEKK